LIEKGTEKVGLFWIIMDMRQLVAQTHMLIGNENWQGKGIIFETRGALIDMLFNIGITRIFGMPRADNYRAINIYKAQGFQEEGRLRRHYYHPEGHMEDAVVFGILREEWSYTKGAVRPKQTSLR
jgi:RimJ/RimL family protein N-acetyltransferase